MLSGTARQERGVGRLRECIEGSGRALVLQAVRQRRVRGRKSRSRPLVRTFTPPPVRRWPRTVPGDLARPWLQVNDSVALVALHGGWGAQQPTE